MTSKKDIHSPPEIEDQIIPGTGEVVKSYGGYKYDPPEMPPIQFPTAITARNLVGASLDTQSRRILTGFGFAKQGAFVVGSLNGPGVAFSQNGLVAKNSAGTTTFTLDGATGSATFLGTLKVGSVIEAGALVVGTNVDIGTAQTASQVTTIVGNTVTTGYVNALNITAKYVAASISITSPTITGGTLQTATSGARFVISGSQASAYSSGGTELVRLSGSGLGIFGTGGNVIQFKNSASGTLYGQMAYDSGVAGLYVSAENGAHLVTYGDDDLYVFANHDIAIVADDNVYIGPNIHAKSISMNYGQNEGNIYDVDQIRGYNDLRLYSNGSGDQIRFYCNAGGGDLTMYPYYGDFYATGTKYFRIPHPDHPKDGWIQYVSVESPEVYLTIRGKSQLNMGEARIELPRHWNLVTANNNTTVNLTPLDDCKGLFAPAYELTNESFTVKEMRKGKSNIEFTWELSAIRKGYEDFNPEQTLDDDAERNVIDMIERENEPEAVIAKETEHEERVAKTRQLMIDKYKKITGKTIDRYEKKVLTTAKSDIVDMRETIRRNKISKPVVKKGDIISKGAL